MNPDAAKAAHVMDEAALAEIEQRAEAATDGPWKLSGHADSDDAWCVYQPRQLERNGAHGIADTDWGTEADVVFIAHARTDTMFIAHARTDVPALVAECRRLSVALADLRAKVAAVEALIHPDAGMAVKHYADGVRFFDERDIRSALAAAPSGEPEPCCSTCGESFAAPPCCTSPEGGSGHTVEGGCASAAPSGGQR